MITDKNYRGFSIGAKAQRLFIMREKGLNVPELVCVKSKDELTTVGLAFSVTNAFCI